MIYIIVYVYIIYNYSLRSEAFLRNALEQALEYCRVSYGGPGAQYGLLWGQRKFECALFALCDLQSYGYVPIDQSKMHLLMKLVDCIGSTAGGHYVAICKHPVSHKWHEFNDNRYIYVHAISYKLSFILKVFIFIVFIVALAMQYPKTVSFHPVPISYSTNERKANLLLTLLHNILAVECNKYITTTTPKATATPSTATKKKRKKKIQKQITKKKTKKKKKVQ